MNKSNSAIFQLMWTCFSCTGLGLRTSALYFNRYLYCCSTSWCIIILKCPFILFILFFLSCWITEFDVSYKVKITSQDVYRNMLERANGNCNLNNLLSILNWLTWHDKVDLQIMKHTKKYLYQYPVALWWLQYCTSSCLTSYRTCTSTVQRLS